MTNQAPIEHYFETNRQGWNERAQIHAKSRFYDLEGMRSGRNALMPIEREELGDVNGKSLLHLQCHIGTDTLSWAKLGAQVTGVDLSDESIAVAEELKKSLNLDARFINANIYDLPDLLDDKFDIVFTSYGALCWLPDIPRWAEIAASYLKPGGTFYIAEFHPLANSICEGIDGDRFQFTYPYFPQEEPYYFDPGPTYTDGEEQTKTGSYEWPYSLGQVVTSLTDVGLHIEFLHEHPCAAYAIFPGMTRDQDGLWWRTDTKIPLMFSIMARKQGG